MALSDLPFNREQQLPLCCRRAVEPCWLECSQSCPCLYRQRQTLRSLLPKSTMHDCALQVSGYSHPRVSTTNAHRSWPIHRVFTGTTTTQESRHFVRGTEKLDQAGSLALTAQVRSGTVLLRSGSTEYQATRAVPHPANSSACSHHLKTTTTIPPTPHMPHNRPNPGLFSTATGVYALLPGGRLFFLW